MEKLEIKADLAISETGEITGIAWPFGSADSTGDIINKGAFNIAVTDLPILLGHNPEEPIGLWEEIKETDQGLMVKGRLFINESKRARAVLSMIKSRLIGGLSIGFYVKKAMKHGANRVISLLDLIEISVVKSPAHPLARVTAKNIAAARVEAMNNAIKAIRNL